MQYAVIRLNLGPKRAFYYVAALLIGSCLLCAALAYAAGPAASPAWASPSAVTVRRASDLPAGQHEPVLLSNLDCTLMPYYAATNNTPHTGCFTRTTAGLLDSDSDTILFAGSNRGVPLIPYSAHEILVPWPGSGAMLALDSVSTGGAYISLYESPLASVQNHWSATGQLLDKQLLRAPDLTLKDPSGTQLVINPQTMAFSDDGSWMVVENLSGAFIRVNLATLDMVAFAPTFGSLGSPGLLKSQVAVSSNGRYIAIANKDAGSLKVYDLSTCGPDGNDLQPRSCTAYDYQTAVAAKITGLQIIKHLRFVNDGLLSFEGLAADSAVSGVYELAPSASITSLIDYLGLGDSYTSGEGAFDYIAGTDTDDNRCHLSVHSYPLLLAQDLFTGAGGHSVACSGAEMNDVSSTAATYKGQVRGVASLQQLQQTQAGLLGSIMSSYTPGYVAQQQFVRQYQPAIITVSVGGNDIGFGDILQRCATPQVNLPPGNNTCYSTYEDRLEVTNLIDRTVPRWTALYKQLVSEAPGTRLYVIGYPQITDDQGNCATNVHLDRSELAFAEDLTNYLNSSIKQAADAAGANYVDVSQAFMGHRLCEAASYDVAVNGLTAGTDAGPFGLKIFGKESYHPTALGQALLEQAILRQTDNLGSLPASSIGSTARNILDAPKTGRPVNVLVPDDSLTTGVAQAGRSLTIEAGGSRNGLAPGTVYTIRLDGASGPVIGRVTSNEYGDVSGVSVLPSDTASGGHTVDVTGQNQAGEPVDVTQPLYIRTDEDNTGSGGANDSGNSGEDAGSVRVFTVLLTGSTVRISGSR